MKKIAILIILLFLIASLSLMASDEKPQSLKEIYKTGKVRFVEQLRIPGASFPEDKLIRYIGGIIENIEGDVFILDTDSHHILKFDSKGKYLKTIGREGQGPGDFSIPTSMTIKNDHIYVYEFGNYRFSVLDNQGKFLKIIKTKQAFGWVRKLAWLPNGDVVMEHFRNHRTGENPQESLLNLYTKDFKFKKTLVSKRIKHFIYVQTVMLRQPYPDTLIWDWDGISKLVYGFSRTFQLTLFDFSSGKKKIIDHKYEPVGITQQEKDEFFKDYNWEGKRLKGKVPKVMIDNSPFPEHKPPFFNMAFDHEGNLIVFPLEKSSFFYVFHKSGEFLTRVDLPVALRADVIFNPRGNDFWFYHINEENEDKQIIKYKLTR